MAALITYEVPKNGGRVIEFRVKGPTGYLSLAGYTSVNVVVDGPDGSNIYTAPCPAKDGDPTVRLVTITGTATATAGVKSACVHWVDANGLADAERFQVAVYEHAV